FGAGGLVQMPDAGMQIPAAWHWSLAVHTTGFVPTQLPDWQVSVRVQALPSLQPVLFGACGLVQVAEEGSEVPAVWHPSVGVQALPSLQPSVLLRWTQPVPGLHESVVHGLPSSQEVTHITFVAAANAEPGPARAAILARVASNCWAVSPWSYAAWRTRSIAA